MCLFRSDAATAKAPQVLWANCGGRGLLLGSAQTYEALFNPALQAMLVDLQNGSDRRLLLITMQPSGVPRLEDLSGQVALAAGRGPISALTGIAIDSSSFAATGTVAVSGGTSETSRTGSISVGEQIALERARQGAAATN